MKGRGKPPCLPALVLDYFLRAAAGGRPYIKKRIGAFQGNISPMNRRLSTLFLALALFPAQAAFSQTTPPSPTPYTYDQLKANLTRYIQDQVIGHDNIRGLSIALVDGGEVVWVKGFGYADGATQTLATENTRYALGGVSRIFTAAEVLHLAEMGKVSLDLPLPKIIPGFSIHSRFAKTKSITLHMLLGDHSGLPGFFLKGIWVDHPESLSDLVTDLKSDYLYDPPGGHYRYSYTDYDLLGRAVELRRKKPFAEAMTKDLFEPLRMESSAFERPAAGGNTAKGYIGGNPVTQSGLRDVPAAGMMSSANDMAKFLTFLFGADSPGPSPLSEKSRDDLLTSQYPHKPLDFGHEVGMGWNLNGLNFEGSGEIDWCDGTYPGYYAQVMVLKEEKLGLVVLSNSSEAGKIADDLAGRALKLALQVKKGIKANLEKKKIEMPKLVEVPREKLETYAGVYTALGQLTHVQLKEKYLGLEFQGHDLDLLPISQETFVPHITFIIFPIDLPQYPLTFTAAAGKDVILLGGLHFPIPFERIVPVKIPEAWKLREGEYELENPDGQMAFSRIALEQKGEFFRVVLKVSLKALNIKEQEFKIALIPHSDEDAVIPGLFYGDGGTLHALEDEKGDTRIFYSGYWFVKKKKPELTPALLSPKPVVPSPAPMAK